MRWRDSIAVVWLASALGGCAFGTTEVGVAHSPLSATPPSGPDVILVQPFVDDRPTDHRNFIGNKRNGFGGVLGHLGTPDGVRLEDVLTRAFVDALQHAGYRATLLAKGSAPVQPYTAVLQGSIQEFWTDMYPGTWLWQVVNTMDVRLVLKDPAGARSLWDRKIHGENEPVAVTDGFDKGVRASIDVALDHASKEFASPAFKDALKQAAPPAAAPPVQASPGPVSEIP